MAKRGMQFRYSVFIAYHGTYDMGGTALEADRIRENIVKYPVAKAYSGPNTDENTFDKHVTEVIPDSALFLLVVNDFCPQDESGSLNKEISSYLYGEIEAFFGLYKSGLRNKKDFAVYYCGNTHAQREAQMSYVGRLLMKIDPDGELCEGNQFYVIDNNLGLDAWINSRLVKPDETVLVDEPYYPFSLLREKVKSMLDAKPKDIFVLQMERGMGKTTFVHALEADPEFAKFATVKAIYVSRDKNYSSPENFLWDFSDLMREDENGKRRSVDIMPVDIINSDPVESFTRFVNEFKTKCYADKKLLIVIDGIDDMGIGGKMKLTDFFETADFRDGVYVMFSSRIFSETDSHRNAAYAFIKRFGGEKIIFDSKNVDYLNFLYNYFNDNIISRFSGSGVQVNVKNVFTNITPKNILAFSILMKIGEIYFTRSKPENVDWHVLSSLENALGFYYNYMKGELNRDVFDRYKKLLAVFALSDYNLTAEDINSVFDLGFSEELLDKNGFMRIFIRVHDETVPVTYGIFHDRIKQLILADEASETEKLVDEIYLKLIMLTGSEIDLDKMFGERKSLFKFLGTLLSGDALAAEEKEQLAKSVFMLNYRQDWTKSAAYVESELFALKALAEYLETSGTSLCEEMPAQAGLVYAAMAQDCYLQNCFYESGDLFRKSMDYYTRANVRSSSYKVQRDYAEMLTIYGTYMQLCRNNEKAIELFAECIDLSDDLYAKGEIPLGDYTHYYVAKSNIYHSLGNYVEQKKTLDKAMKIGGKELREHNPARFAFMNGAYASFYSAKGKHKKALSYVETALGAYKRHYETDWHTMFVGDMVACAGTYINSITKIYKDNKRCLQDARREYDFINEAIKRTEFDNPNIDMRVSEAMARCYCKLGMKKECMDECIQLLGRIDDLMLRENKKFASVEAYQTRVREILAAAEKL